MNFSNRFYCARIECRNCWTVKLETKKANLFLLAIKDVYAEEQFCAHVKVESRGYTCLKLSIIQSCLI